MVVKLKEGEVLGIEVGERMIKGGERKGEVMK